MGVEVSNLQCEVYAYAHKIIHAKYLTVINLNVINT